MGTIVIRKIKLEDADVERVRRGEIVPLSRIRELEGKQEK